MKKSPKTIITCAVTGSIHTPSMSSALPFTPQQIAEQAIDAVGQGAAILHLHARQPSDGAPSPDPDIYQQFLDPIMASTDAVINLTTGGSPRMSMDDRLAAARRFAPEIASCNMGSMNFVYSGAADRVSTWRFEWERDYLLGSEDVVFTNTFRQIEKTLVDLGSRGTRFGFECYDVGHLYTLAHFVDKGLVQPPFFIQMVVGVLGGIGADHANLAHMILVADKLFGDDYALSAFAAGRSQIDFAVHTALLGGNVRVGLEDGLYLSRGVMAESNADQVEKISGILHEMGREIATPDEARSFLGLKGR